jgi:AbrB family looped-hinge helix DNA binding protein
MTRRPSAVVRTRVDRNGRIVLPAEARRHLGVQAGDTLTIELDGEGARLRTFTAAVKEAQSLYRAARGKGKDVDLVAELLKLRKQEFWRD